MKKTLISIVAGSKTDLPVLREAKKVLDSFGISYELRIISAHRSPEICREYAIEAEKRGIEVIIAGASGAAHLPGVIASWTTLPVIGVPMKGSLGGIDSLFSIVQMPTGVPVATMSIGEAGARNAAILAIEILSLRDKVLRKKFKDYKNKLAQEVMKADKECRW